MKKSTKITMIIGLTLLMLAITVVAYADEAAFWMKAPLPQDLGILDKPYGEFTEGECRDCHGTNTANLHHMTPTALDKSDPSAGCIGCHELTADGTIATPIVRKCQTCHENSWHHTTDYAIAGTCTKCHESELLAEQGTGLVAPEKPTYEKTMATPKVKDCANCHNDFNPTWDPQHQVGTTDTRGPNGISHHGTGLQICGFCHDSATGPVSSILDVRMCESCHTITTLHTIVPHTSTPDAITGEIKPDNNKCLGCHGTYMKALPELNTTAIPAIDSMDVTTQKSFGYVVITGTNFGDNDNFGTVVLTNGATSVPAASSNWTDTQIRIMVPDKIALGNYDVKVNVSGRESNIKSLTVVGNPYISGMTPTIGLASTATAPVYVTLTGTNFATGTDLRVNFVQGAYKAAVVPQQNANGDLIAQVPVGMRAGKYLVNVSTSIGTSNTVYYTVGTAPKVVSVSPTSAKTGASVAITGYNLSLGSKPTVRFGTVAATVKSYTATKVYVTVPSMAGVTTTFPYKTTLTLNNGFADSQSVTFTVK